MTSLPQLWVCRCPPLRRGRRLSQPLAGPVTGGAPRSTRRRSVAGGAGRRCAELLQALVGEDCDDDGHGGAGTAGLAERRGARRREPASAALRARGAWRTVLVALAERAAGAVGDRGRAVGRAGAARPGRGRSPPVTCGCRWSPLVPGPCELLALAPGLGRPARATPRSSRWTRSTTARCSGWPPLTSRATAPVTTRSSLPAATRSSWRRSWHCAAEGGGAARPRDRARGDRRASRPAVA